MGQSTGTSRHPARRLAKRQGCGSRKRSKPNVGACTRKPKPRSRLRCSVPLKPSAWRSSKRTNVLRSRKLRSAPPNSSRPLSSAPMRRRPVSGCSVPAGALSGTRPRLCGSRAGLSGSSSLLSAAACSGLSSVCAAAALRAATSGSGRTACTWPALEPG